MLSIAKELYIRGNFHATRKSISDSILAILNFDFAGETILKAVLLNNGGSIARKNGGFKTFDEIIQDFKNTFPNIYTEEVNNLHKLRNDVQHHCNIPSNQEVLRHNNTIKLFFDEICQKAYSNTISYESISLALFIESESEKLILKNMDDAFQRKEYSDSVYYSKQAAIYHIMLLRESVEAPGLSKFNSSTFISDDFYPIKDVADTIQGIVQKLNWAVDRIYLREHYDSIKNLLDGNISQNLSWDTKQKIVRGQSSLDEAERNRNIVYEFIVSTQDLIKKQDLETPFIFDLSVKKTASPKDFDLQVGVISKLPIILSKITIRRNPSNEIIDNPAFPNEVNLDIQKKNGLQTFPVRFDSGRKYTIHCEVTNEVGKTDYFNIHNFHVD
jgi:hypothetical protein